MVRRLAIVTMLLLPALARAGGAPAEPAEADKAERAYADGDEAFAPAPRSPFEAVSAHAAARPQLVLVDGRKPKLDVAGGRIEASRGWLEAFPEDDLRAAGFALAVARTETGGAPPEGEAAFLLAVAGRDPASLVAYVKALPERVPGEKADPARVARAEAAAAKAPDQARWYGNARLAMSFGGFDAARRLLQPIADALPESPEVRTNTGLAWMGTFYATNGLRADTWTRVQGLLVDPSADPGLGPDELAAVLARGFAVSSDLPSSSVRGVSHDVPVPLLRAHEALDAAAKLVPDAPGAQIDRFVCEVEIARFDASAAPDLDVHRKAIRAAVGSWSTADAALAWLDLGVDAYLVGDAAKSRPENVEAAIAAFDRADTLGNPAGRFDRGLVLAFDPDAPGDRRQEGRQALASFSDAARQQDLASRGGVLASNTPWPLGAGWVELRSGDPDVAELVAVIDGKDPEGAERHAVGDLSEVTLPGGAEALVEQGRGAWVVLPAPPPPASTVDIRITAVQPAAVTSPVLTADAGPRVRVRTQAACVDDEPLSADSRGADCPTLLEVRLLE